jgi:hypothetical protein
MTKEEIINLSREKIADIIAEKIMGWHRVWLGEDSPQWRDENNNTTYSCCRWNPTGNLHHSWEAIIKARPLLSKHCVGCTICFGVHTMSVPKNKNEDGNFGWVFAMGKDDGVDIDVEDPYNMPISICRAILIALKDEIKI